MSLSIESEFTIATVIYLLFILGWVFPPPEFDGFGITFEKLFIFCTGDENMHFTQYHIRLTTTRLCVHSFFIPSYYLHAVFNFGVIELQWLPFFICMSPSVFAFALSLYWWAGGTWDNHPFSKLLAAHASHPREWPNVANALATEFRRVDKFVNGPTWGKVVVTDNWIVRCGLYYVNLAYQPDVHMSIQSSEEHTDVTHLTSQYININVSSINGACSDFKIRLISTDFNDLSNKVTGTILNVRNIVFAQTLSERFEAAFRQEVSNNGLYHTERSREECIGCLYAISDVKLSKLCEDVDVGDCRNCLCRPMWCIRCMAKWFASRQEQGVPERWMAGKAPCPTCRSKFCIRDVQLLA